MPDIPLKSQHLTADRAAEENHMIRKLRRRFIAAAMAAVVLVLFVIMGTINILNYHNVVSESDAVLQLLADNSGSFPDSMGQNGGGQIPEKPEDVKSDSESGISAMNIGENPAGADPADGMGGSRNSMNPADNPNDPGKQGFSLFSFLHGQNGMSAETPYESRYFTVTFDAEGNVTDANVESIAAIDTDSAEAMAESVLSSGSDRGFSGYYRYKKTENDDDGTMLIFLDCQRSLSNVRSFLIISILVCLIGTAAVLILVILLSARIVKPAEESYLKQKRFITDAGHDLKTPLTVIDADVSVLEMDTGKNEWLDDILVQTKRMTDLTNDLIYLSRMDEGENRMTMIDFPLSDVISETVQSFRSRAQVEEKDFDYEIEPMITYCGDEKYMTRLVTILLDNAFKYSDDHGTIRVSLRSHGKGFILKVYNTAESVDHETLTHMFDRFYRADKSRNSSRGGYGIGLSIASAITAAHKGKITASSDDGRSMLITATF